MNFVFGVCLSALFMTCLLLEIFEFTRPLFSVIFLGGIIAIGVALFTKGVLLTPLFIIGFILNVLFFMPIFRAAGQGVKEYKEEKDGRRQ